MNKWLLTAAVTSTFLFTAAFSSFAAVPLEPSVTAPSWCDTHTCGWVQENGSCYYFNDNGQAVTGECVIDGNAYTFDADGSLISEGIHRDGLEDDLLSDAFVLTKENWEYTLYAIDLVNQERKKAGQPALEASFDLSVVAAYRCLHMNKYNYFAHDYDTIDQNNYDWMLYSHLPSNVGENIQLHGDVTDPNNGIINTETPTEQVKHSHDLLVASSGHYRNMVDPLAHTVGAAIFRNDHQTRDYYTMLFLPEL